MEKIRLGIPYYDESELEMAASVPEVANIMNLISEPLLRLYDGKIWSALARSWQVFERGRRWLFYLSPNTLFTDSTPCTMADVVASVENAKAANNEFGFQSSFSSYLKKFEFSILNRYALQVTCSEPSGDLAEILSAIPIVKKNRLGKPIIGTGNYKYASYWANKTIRLTKLPERKHLSAYSQITFFVIPDAQERLEALRKGDIHIAVGMESIAKKESGDGNEWWTCRTNHSVMGMLNGFRRPFNQPLARRAVNLAVDVDAIIKDILDGYAFPSASIVSPYHCGYNNLLDPIPYDPALARRLFSQVDIDRELVITAIRNFPEHSFEIADRIASQLMDVGLKVRVDKYYDMQEYYQKQSEGNLGDIMLTMTSSKSTFRILHDAISSTAKGPFWQGINDDVLQGLIEEANIECDITERERCYSKVVTHLNRNPHWLYLYHPIAAYVRTSGVDDVESLHSGELRFPGAW